MEYNVAGKAYGTATNRAVKVEGDSIASALYGLLLASPTLWPGSFSVGSFVSGVPFLGQLWPASTPFPWWSWWWQSPIGQFMPSDQPTVERQARRGPSTGIHEHKRLEPDILRAETNSGKPSKGDFERMARRRFQNPKPFRSGKWWYLLYWQDQFAGGERVRKKKRMKLAPATMPEREVRKIAAEILRPMNQGLVTIGSATNFGEFVESVYRPVVMPLFARSTQHRYSSVIKNYLKPAFEGSCLRDLTPLTVQRFLTGLGTSNLAHESRDKIRDVLASIMSSAVQYQLLVKNPVEGLRLPPSRNGRRSKPYLTPEQFATLVELVAEPYASMIFVAVFTGLRVSELVGLRWRSVHADSITIDERYCRGEQGPPKSNSSNATIAVNQAVIERLQRLKTLTVAVRAGTGLRQYRVVRSDGPDDLVFQSLVKGGHMRDNNILVRHIKPAGAKLGLGFVNWRCLRTSHATWLKLAGADVKDAQAQMRHSRATTTLDIYTQFVPESQRRAVDRLSGLTGAGRVN
jgi:integrase